MIEAAFVGWQVAGAFGGGKDFPTFEKYLSSMGLAPKGKSGPSAAERDREKLAKLERMLGRKTPIVPA